MQVPNPGPAGGHKGYGFVEYKEERQAQDAITNMNNFDLCGRPLKVGTVHAGAFQSDLTGPLMFASDDVIEPEASSAPVSTPSSSSSITQDTSSQGVSNPNLPPALPPAIPDNAYQSQPPPLNTARDRCIVLRNILDVSDVDEDLEEEIKDECQRFGPVTQMHLQVLPEKNEVNVFVVYLNHSDAGKALQALDQRLFGGRTIAVTFYPTADFENGIYKL